jgi:beta-glucanase (GH16 family)
MIGINYTLSQVTINTIADPKNWTGPGELGGDPGLRLTVDGGFPKDGYIKTGQVDSARTDMLWGTYRASMKLTPTNGTCAAFFWVCSHPAGCVRWQVVLMSSQYFDDSQEIDMEFLSDQFNFTNGSFPVNLVLQANKSIKSGFNSADTGNFRRIYLPFDPTTSYHEYRIDYVPGSIVFYADTEVLTRFDASTIPFSPGHLILTHWSNGNILWSAGPPVTNATLSVGYVKAYFNSSLPNRHSDWAHRCKDPSAKDAICVIPDQNTAPDPAVVVKNTTSAQGNFFSNNENQTVNQTVYHKSTARSDIHGGYTTLGTIVLSMFVFLFLFH